MKLVECVPNFSEGRRPEVVAKIRDAMAAVKGAHILDVSSDQSHNRTVITLVVEASGSPDALRAALRFLAHEGTALVASWYGTKEVSLPLGGDFHRRRLTIRSTQVSTIPARLSARWSYERRCHAVIDLLPELPLHQLATHTFCFDRAGDAYAAIDAGCEGLVHAALGYR